MTENDKELLQFRVSPAWKKIEILSEPFVKYTSWGYSPYVKVRVEDKMIEQILNITPKSLATPLSKLVEANNGSFKGLLFKVKKESAEQRSPYVVESL